MSSSAGCWLSKQSAHHSPAWEAFLACFSLLMSCLGCSGASPHWDQVHLCQSNKSMLTIPAHHKMTKRSPLIITHLSVCSILPVNTQDGWHKSIKDLLEFKRFCVFPYHNIGIIRTSDKLLVRNLHRLILKDVPTLATITVIHSGWTMF